MGTKNDYTSTGLKIEGNYENDRNSENSQLFKDIIREAYCVEDVIIGHHLIYEKRDKRDDNFTYEVVQEIPSADALIFDHAVAKIIWGKDWLSVLQQLVAEPIETRDKLLSELYYGRVKKAA